MKTYNQRMEEILKKAKRAKAFHRMWKASATILTVLALVIGVSLLWPKLNDFLLFVGTQGPSVYNSQPLTKPDPPHTCPEYVTYDVDVRTPEGKPIEGIDVYIFMNEDRLDIADYGITDANGQFSCVLELSYHYVVSVDLPEYIQCEEPPEDYYKFSGSNCQVQIVLNISEPPAEPTDPEKVYETYSVSVYTPEGAPAEGVTVYIYYHERDWWELFASGVTDANGQISFFLQESSNYFASLSTPSFVDGSPEDYCNFDVNGQIVLYTSESTYYPLIFVENGQAYIIGAYSTEGVWYSPYSFLYDGKALSEYYGLEMGISVTSPILSMEKPLTFHSEHNSFTAAVLDMTVNGEYATGNYWVKLQMDRQVPDGLYFGSYDGLDMVPESISYGNALVSADLDSDGDMDQITWAFEESEGVYSYTVTVERNGQSYSFERWTEYFGYEDVQILVADVNRDGYMELIVYEKMENGFYRGVSIYGLDFVGYIERIQYTIASMP